MHQLTNKQLAERIEELDPRLAHEVMRCLNMPQPVDMEMESYVDRLQRENERLTAKARALNEGVI